MGARSRTKGHAWEREVAEKIREATGLRADRTLNETRDGNCGDIQCPGLPIVWQCKVGARPDIYAAVSEAEDVAESKHHFAVAVTKKNGARHTPPVELATLPLEHFMEIVSLLRASGTW